MNYSEINLNEKIQQGLADAGYVACTPVQEQVLQASLDGSDLYVQSQTGTGKTAAYLVSIMQELLANLDEKKTALVMVPTRELAIQVEDEANKLGKHTGLVFASFFGGVGYDKQVAALKRGVDVIIGTPGRVIDLQQSGQMDLSRVGFLAIDEADRMFDMGFYPDLRKLITVLPSSEGRQTMLFSATLNLNVKNLAYEYTKEPKEITIEAENITVDEIDQVLMHVSSDDKNRLLVGIIQRENPESLIIFCNTKKMCEIISKRLKINGIENEFIIGDLPQKKRQQIMNNFKSGKVKCLIATDVAARGIDVNDLAMVINYDLPNEAENYVHRIGRTARAGKTGKAYSFCTDATEDSFNLMGIESYIEKKIPFVVAVEEDFAEDKSREMWIKTGDWREDGDGFEHRRERRSEHRNRSGRAGRRERTEKNARVADSKISDEELEKMANMSFEERMKLYKEKYASGSDSSKTDSAGSAGKGKNRKRRGKKADSQNPNKENQGRVKNGEEKERKERPGKREFRKNPGKPNQSRKNQNQRNTGNRNQNRKPAKKGLFAKIKAFFTGK